MKNLRRLGMVVVLLGGGATRVAAQAYEVSWWTLDAGGAQGQIGSAFAIDGTIGQPDAAGPVPGGAFEATSGFWSVVAGGSTGTAADLAVTISDSPDPVPAGAPLTYTVEVRNLGPATSPALSLRDTLPPAATFVSSVPGPPACVHLKGDVNCTFADVPPGAARTVTIEVTVASWSSGALTNTAIAIGGTPDPVPANNVDVETTVVIGRARAEIAHGTTLRADLAPAAGQVVDEDRYRQKQQPRASYEIVLDEASGDVGVGAGPALDRLSPDGLTVLQASVAAGAGPGRSLRWENDSSAAVVDQEVRVRSLSCGSDCGGDDAYRLRAYETTGFVPRFNNANGQVTLLLLHNSSTKPVSGHIHFWSASGAPLVTWPFALAPRQPFVLNTAGVPGLAGVGGSVTVSHDGRYGELAGKTVALDPSTGLSFDTPLEVRPR